MSNTYFNVVAAKEAIRKRIDESQIKQKDVYEYLKMQQSDCSKRLSVKEKSFFTVEQLWRLADLLDCSVDELLGRGNAPQMNVSDEDVSLADVCAALDYFNRIAKPKYQASEGKAPIIWSDSPEIKRLIKRFANLSDSQKDLSIFVKAFIRDEENQKLTRKFDFKTEYGCGKYWIEQAIKNEGVRNEAYKLSQYGGSRDDWQYDDLLSKLEAVVMICYNCNSSSQRDAMYKAIPTYIKENGVAKESIEDYILRAYERIYEENHPEAFG